MPDLTVARHWALAWTVNGQVYIGGGRPDASTYLTTIESYDTSANQWRVIGNLPYGAYQTDTALINGKLYLSGGYDGSSHSNKLYVADLNPVTAFSAGGDHSRFVQADGSLWAMGRNHVGQLGDGTTTDRSSPVKIETVNWEEKASHSQATDVSEAAQVIDVKIYLAGGRTISGVTSRFERYDPTSDSWTILTSMSTPREDMASVVAEGKFYAIGGSNDSGVFNSIEIFDPETQSWSSGVSLPVACRGGAAVVWNDKIILIGGA